jgi:hypothetical protein
MSEFIQSYFNTPQKKTKMKFYSHLSKTQWSIHIIPVIDLYIESRSPLNHKRISKDGFSGLYLSIIWLDRSYTFGVHHTLK